MVRGGGLAGVVNYFNIAEYVWLPLYNSRLVL